LIHSLSRVTLRLVNRKNDSTAANQTFVRKEHFPDLHHAGFDPFVIPPTAPRPSTLGGLFDIPQSMKQTKDDKAIFKDGAVKHLRIDTDDQYIPGSFSKLKGEVQATTARS
jgi:hypothetical protein